MATDPNRTVTPTSNPQNVTITENHSPGNKVTTTNDKALTDNSSLTLNTQLTKTVDAPKIDRSGQEYRNGVYYKQDANGNYTIPADTPVPPTNYTGGGGGGGSSTPTTPSYDINTKLNMPKQKTQEQIAKERAALSAALNPEAETAEIDRVNYYDKQPLVDMMDQQIAAARQQYNQQIDYAMDTEARDLNRALTDAQAMYQTQQNAINANELNALDNAALYAEARGDKGGIGQAQYNSIQNTAAMNRQSVQSAQTKMATDTMRQISDLRAQGEFDKADRMLQLTQEYLSQLQDIEKFAANYNLSVDQVNTAISEWEYEFDQAAQQFATNTELSLAQLTGMFSNGTKTYQAQQDTDKAMADIALAMISPPISAKPTSLSKDMLGALQRATGMDQKAINAYYIKANSK